ncbi:ATP-binding protein [Streptomyces sp. NPDC051940]|uniref:sensor histidine kinase n=1 Tax=Streptomyces sp. NPDC051940 TaxID=3155675 RepID=UPI0034228AA7
MTSHQDAARPPARRLSPPLLALLISVAATVIVVTLVVATAPGSAQTSLAYVLSLAGVVVCAAVTGAAHFREAARKARRKASAESAAAATQTSAAASEAARFADETLPAVLSRLGQGASATTAVNGVRMPDNPAYQRALRQIAESAAQSENRRAAAMAACANAAGRMQALSTSMLSDLRDMEHRHADTSVLADLLHLDHRTSQAGRVADSIAVLSGARSGRRWAKPIGMESVLRGAMGRIAGYQRVRLRAVGDLSVAGHAAEGVMHVLAELLDNACNFSPPTTEVHVYVAEVPAGVAVTIEDAGLVMSPTALRRAEKVTSGEVGDLSALTGTRLGLAVVGILARKHGLTVSFRPSAIGGTGVVVMIPQDLVSRQPAPQQPLPVVMEPEWAVEIERADEPAAPAELPPAPRAEREREPDTDHASVPDETPATGEPTPAHGTLLPKRRRGRTMASAHPDGLPGDQPRPARPAADQPRDAAASVNRFGAFMQAVRGEETPGEPRPDDSPANDTHSRTKKDNA